MQNNYCVIMAGGVGSRFWPLSTSDRPKQFLDPLGLGKSFLRLTFERFLPVVPIDNFLIVTSEKYKSQVMEHIPELKENQILLEPMRRNTAPCIAYATWRMAKTNPNARMVVSPSDHLIVQEDSFRKIVNDGLEFVGDSDNLLTIGIKPTRPETGYGYIQFDKNVKIGNHNKVKTFTEKPNLELANAFLKSGDFLWNSGIFVWSVKGIKSAMKEFLPELVLSFDEGESFYGTDKEQQFINHLYPQCQNISIDYGIMEKSQKVYVHSGDFGWSDIGTWGSLQTHMDSDENGNVISGQVVCYDSKNSLVMVEPGKVAIVQGLDRMLVVNEKDRLLVCRIEDEQSLRNWTEDVKKRFSGDYL